MFLRKFAVNKILSEMGDMTATAAQADQPVSQTPASPVPKKSLTWEAFQRKYLTREDGYTYEWVDGQVEKTKNAVNPRHFFIQDNLTFFFNQLRIKKKITGQLIAEGDIFFGKNHRRPDMAYLNAEQITQMAHGQTAVPAFVIKVISTNDQINLLHKKMRDYRHAGVQVVWHILPELEEVHVFTGDGLRQSTICRDDDWCSAEPVLPEYKMKVSDLFKVAE